METSEKEVDKNLEQKSKGLEKWLRNPSNLLLILVFLFVFSIRLYYFFLTMHQPLWWDESEYMAGAKGFAGLVDYHLNSIRAPGFSLIASLFFIAGIENEAILRFFLCFLPSLIVILLAYVCIKEMYPDRRIALISVLILSVLWEHLFYSYRFQTENMALLFEFLAIAILFKCYLKKEKFSFITSKYSLVWIFLFSVISAVFRPGNLIFLPALLVFILLLKTSWIFENKKRRNISLLVLISVIVLLLISAPFLLRFPALSNYYNPKNNVTWNTLNFFYGIYQSLSPPIPSVFFYAFLLGAVITILSMAIRYDKLKNLKRGAEDLLLKSDLFNILLLISVMFSFIFLIRPVLGFEYRWFFPLLTALLAVTGRGIVSFSDYLSKTLSIKKLSAILILIILLLGMYTQIARVDPLMKQKKDSYLQVKEAGLWTKENSLPSDTVISASIPQNTYYSERVTYDFYVNNLQNETAFYDKIKEIKPKYLVVSAFEPGFTPKWAYDWPQNNSDLVTPVNALFFDKEKTQPALVIYEFKNYTKSVR